MYYAYACITYSESEARESNPKIILGDKDIVSICMYACVCMYYAYACSDARDSRAKNRSSGQRNVSIYMCVCIMCMHALHILSLKRYIFSMCARVRVLYVYMHCRLTDLFLW